MRPERVKYGMCVCARMHALRCLHLENKARETKDKRLEAR